MVKIKLKKRYRYITTAESTEASELVQDKLKSIKDDFDYIVDGVDKLSRQGQRASDTLAILDSLESSLSEITAEIAKYIVEAL